MRRTLVPRKIVLMMLGATAALATLPAAAAPPVAVELGTTQIQLDAAGSWGGFHLRVTTPSGDTIDRTFASTDPVVFALAELDEAADGFYKWELTASPGADQPVMSAVGEARANERGLERRTAGAAAGLVATGSFRVVARTLVSPYLAEPPPAPEAAPRPGAFEVVTAPLQVFNMDVIVQGSICVGIDCASSESFGFDTVRLKENNLRIKFQDTSSSGSFPTVDWELVANDSANGGANYFRIRDVDHAKDPFTVEANAPSHSLYVESTGDIGIGTSTPALDVHVKSGNTPAIRLEQDNSSGFTPQTWDVAGNEANFFVRDVTGGSDLPLRIYPGTGDDNLVLRDGQVGVGTNTPERPFDVVASGAADNTVIEIENDGPARMRMNNSGNGEIWNMGHQAPGGTGFVISDVGDSTSEMLLDVDGNLIISGTLTTGSNTNYPDYVFAEDYELMPLATVAEFIRRNGHLPRIPTAADVQRSGGVNLTELQLLLLEKVEELTLYTVEQDRLIGGLSAENEALKTRLEALEKTLAGK